MTFRQNLARSGNENRIMEMSSAGMGENQIAGVFADNGMPKVTAVIVRGVINSYAILGEQALPKKVVKMAISAHQGSGNFGLAS